MIYLFTGTPGGGKTLSALEFIEKRMAADPSLVVYQHRITDCTMPGVIELEEEQIREWWLTCEKNSLIVIDEAQRIWRAGRAGDVPQAVVELETHRHDGIDIVMITQHPTFLHANVRKLVNTHVHVVAYTGSSSLRWEWRECHDNVSDNALRQTGEFSEWKYPTHLYNFYRSATKHNPKPKRSRRQIWGRIGLIFFGVVMLGLVVGFGLSLRTYFKARDAANNPSKGQGSGKGATASAARAQGGSGGGTSPKWDTVQDYVASQVPRLPTQPWSAPLYDQSAPTAHPHIWCAYQIAPAKCSCITEQGTKYILAIDLCKQVAETGGAYDPWKVDTRDRDDGRHDAATAVASADSDARPVNAAASIPLPGDQTASAWPAARSAIHDPYVPPELSRREPMYTGK